MVFAQAVEGVSQFLDLGGEDLPDLLLGGELGEVKELLLNCLFEFLKTAIFQHEKVFEFVPVDDGEKRLPFLLGMACFMM